MPSIDPNSSDADLLLYHQRMVTKYHREDLAAGKITEAEFVRRMGAVWQDLGNPTVEAFKTFFATIGEEFTSIPSTINTAGEYLAAVAHAITENAGKIVGGAVGGAASGVAKGLGFSGWVVVLLVSGIVIWAFTRGPLKGFKLTDLKA